MPTLSLEINNRSSILFNPEAAAIALFEAIHASARFPISEGELSIAFVNDAEIAQVHADFMDDHSPTDVITFPAQPEMKSAGEIIVSVDHARSRAADEGRVPPGLAKAMRSDEAGRRARGRRRRRHGVLPAADAVELLRVRRVP